MFNEVWLLSPLEKEKNNIKSPMARSCIFGGRLYTPGIYKNENLLLEVSTTSEDLRKSQNCNFAHPVSSQPPPSWSNFLPEDHQWQQWYIVSPLSCEGVWLRNNPDSFEERGEKKIIIQAGTEGRKIPAVNNEWTAARYKFLINWLPGNRCAAVDSLNSLALS